MAALANGTFSLRPPLLRLSRRLRFKHHSSCNAGQIIFVDEPQHMHLAKVASNFRMRSYQLEDAGCVEALNSRDASNALDEVANGQYGSLKENKRASGYSFLIKLAISLGIAAVVTVLSGRSKMPVLGSSFGIQFLADGSSLSSSAASPAGFTVKAFGYRVLLPEYAPGWIYFWLLMAAACGLFISEEALNIWVGTSLARLLSLDGTWQSFAESFSRNASYITSTVLWVYWGVCISDMIPFYLGKFFSQTKTSDDVYSKLGIGKEKALTIAHAVQRHGNIIGLVERLSFGVRNPTGFLAGALGISPECFFAGVCLGGLITLPLQLGLGFLLRNRPLFALATVASVVGIWTLFPYAVAASTALVLFLRHRYST